MTTHWTQVTITGPLIFEEGILNRLRELSCAGSAVIRESSKSCKIASFFDEGLWKIAHEPLQRYLDALTDLYPDMPSTIESVEEREESEWADRWKSFLKHRTIGKSLAVCPPWDIRADSGRISVIIDPGKSFGTGNHATTQMMLEILEELIAGDSSSRLRSILDAGCGSGVLAIAACKLGAEEVCAIDIDEDAVSDALRNARLNEVAGMIDIHQVSVSDFRGCFDLVLANILDEILIKFSGNISKLVKRGGYLACSGVISPEAPRVIKTFSALGMELIEQRKRGDWVLLLMMKKSRRKKNG